MGKVDKAVRESRRMIEAEAFKEQHRTSRRTFSRVRKLTFSRMIILILQKSVKSIQLILNEWFEHLGGQTVSNSAFTPARANLKHTAFIDLNARMVEINYEDGRYRRYKGFRLLAIDGSQIRLPEGEGIREEFGEISYSNPKAEVNGAHNYAQISVLFDVLNRMVIAGECGKARADEVDLAKQHLSYAQRHEDWLRCDRNYATGHFMATRRRQQLNLVIRCPARFTVATPMLQGQGADNRLVTLKVNPVEAIRVRFVRVRLSTGEDEILATSWLHEQPNPTDFFNEIYHLRWGVETRYALLKTRVELENFSGKTVTSVLPDFYATLYLTSLESILTMETDAILQVKVTSKHPQQVNRRVSFHAIKSEALNLLSSDLSIDKVLKKLRALFLTNPTLNKNQPTTPRNIKTARHLLHYHRTQRKHCF
jgi:hypothetical protein